MNRARQATTSAGEGRRRRNIRTSGMEWGGGSLQDSFEAGGGVGGGGAGRGRASGGARAAADGPLGPDDAAVAPPVAAPGGGRRRAGPAGAPRGRAEGDEES